MGCKDKSSALVNDAISGFNRNIMGCKGIKGSQPSTFDVDLIGT